MDVLHAMKDALMKYETIDAHQIDDIMLRREVRLPADYERDNNSQNGGNSAATSNDNNVAASTSDTTSTPSDTSH